MKSILNERDKPSTTLHMSGSCGSLKCAHFFILEFHFLDWTTKTLHESQLKISCLSWCNCSIQRSHLLKQLVLAPSSFPLSQIFFFSFFSGFWTLSQSCAWDGRNKALLTPNTAESRKPESLISHSRLLSHIPLTFTAWLRFLHLSVVRALVPLGARSPPVCQNGDPSSWLSFFGR